MARKSTGVIRCAWARSELSIRYHDEEWGVPVHDDRTLFEFLILEGAQAGLSWETILNKREHYRTAFDGFDPSLVVRYDRRKVQQLLRNPGIVRNRLKIASSVQNAKAFLRVQEEFGSFDQYVWKFVGAKPRVNSWKSLDRIPARTAESDALSKDLKRCGFIRESDKILLKDAAKLIRGSDSWAGYLKVKQSLPLSKSRFGW